MTKVGANQVWNQLPGLLPLNFFQDPLQIWLSNNSTSKNLVNEHNLPWHLLFVTSLWQIWLARNEWIFKASLITQSQLIHKSIHLAFEFYYTAYPTTYVSNKKTIKWNPPIEYRTFSNFKHGWQGWRWGLSVPVLANGLKASLWILGITSNNVAKLEAVRYGLMLAWNLGFKFVILNLDSTLIIQ